MQRQPDHREPTSTSRRARTKDKAPTLDGALGTRGLPLHDFLDQVEREAIMKALEATRFNKTAAAKLLGITFRSPALPPRPSGDRLINGVRLQLS